MPARKRKSEPAPPQPAKIKLSTRGLWTVGWLAQLLGQLSAVQKDAAWETEVEDDGSTVAAELLVPLKALGALLVKMTEEEVAELLAGHDIDGQGLDEALDDDERAGPLREVRRSIAELSRIDPLARIGKKYSAETLRCMREAHGHAKAAHETLSSMLDEADDDNPEDNDDNEGVDPADENSQRASKDARLSTDYARRAREAEAIKAKAALL